MTDYAVSDRRATFAIAALVYFALYLTYLFLFVDLETEMTHWLTLVLLPLAAFAGLTLSTGKFSISEALKRVGLERGRLTKGVIPAIIIGLVMCSVQLLMSRQADAVLADIASGKFFWAFPAGVGLMMLVAGTTEEFFFRGVLQTSLTDWMRSKTWAVVIASVAFGFYHLPYAYFNENWPTHGDLSAAFMEGVVLSAVMGLIIGAAYARYRNLLVPIIIHSMFNGMVASAKMF